MKTFLLLSCFAITLCTGIRLTCPPREDIRPCVCKVGSDKQPWVTCKEIRNLNSLQKALSKMKGYRFYGFVLDKSNIGVLPADVFSDIEIVGLTISSTQLTDLSGGRNKPSFLGLENSLEVLMIQDGFRDSNKPLSRLSISHLKKLKLLQLAGNMIPSIGNDWFESGPYGLTELDIVAADTKKVGSHVFMSLQNLERLNMAGSALTEITRDMFSKPALYLEAMDFSDNRISVLPNDIFHSMPSLKRVILQNNDFTTIDEVVFAPVWSQLNYVFFMGNPLNCNNDMKWIFKYRKPEFLQGKCVEPTNLQKKTLANLTLADFQ